MPHNDQYGPLEPYQSVNVYIQHACLVMIIVTLLLSVDEVANQLEFPFRYDLAGISMMKTMHA
jgi:uncharacterized protein YjfI (DUF2170 family)